MTPYGDTLRETMSLACKTRDDAQTEVLGTLKNRGVVDVVVAVAAAAAVVAVARIGYKNYTAVWKVLVAVADGQHSNKKVQMTMLRDSFSQFDKETLFSSNYMVLCSEDPLAAILDDFPSLVVTASNDPEAGPGLDCFRLQMTLKYPPHKTP